MDYVVRPLPGVTAELAEQPRSIQRRFATIASELAENPWPNPRLPYLTEDWLPDGRKIYTYSHHNFPYAIHYLIIEPTDEHFGMIAIVDLTRLA